MDLWKMMAQAQANKLQYMQFFANRIRNSNDLQAAARPNFGGYQDPMSVPRINISPIAQTASNISKQATPIHNVALLNLLVENNLLKSQLQSLAPVKRELSKSEESVQERNADAKEENSTPSQTAAATPVGNTQQKGSKKKRYRRLAKQIERINCCPEASCGKAYGSEGSLHQHIRLKHPEFDILTWIRDKIKYGDAMRAKEKEAGSNLETCKSDSATNNSAKN